MLGQVSAVGLDLDDGALAAVEAQALQFPTLDDVRRGFVALQRGLRLPFDGRKAERTRTVLEELELVDGSGHARSGEKRDPYASETLLDGLLHRHLLLRFVTAYRFLDDDGFARSVTTLFGPSGNADGLPDPAAAAGVGPGGPAPAPSRIG
ncbi:MAG: hypothetical protein P8Y02_11305 [Deinococcales bacterium]